MPTYREIQNTEVEVDAPLTQQLLQALKDNLTSVIEDDGTAPSIKRSAISDAVSDQKLAVAGDVSIGAEEVLTVTISQSLQGGSSVQDTNSQKYVIAVAGRYKIQVAAFKLQSSYNGTVRAQLYVNGSLVATAGYIGGSDFALVTLSDYALSAGDEIYIKFEEGNALSTQAKAEVRAFIGVSVETAAFYNRIGGLDIGTITTANAPEFD